MTILKSIRNDWPDRELVDASEPLTVTVEPEDVQRGVRQDPRSCALSWACYRSQEIEEAIIYRQVAYLVTSSSIIRYTLGRDIQTEVVNFDRHGTFETGSYRLKAPTPSTQLEYRRTKGRGASSWRRGPHTSSHPKPKRMNGVRTYSAD